MRSQRLPSAPPSTKVSPAEKRRSLECLARRNTMAAVAAAAIPMNSALCQPPASARKLNAAPRLCASTRLKNGAISRTSPKRRLELIATLLAWSARARSSASASHGAMRFRFSGFMRTAGAHRNRRGFARSARKSPGDSGPPGRGAARAQATARCVSDSPDSCEPPGLTGTVEVLHAAPANPRVIRVGVHVRAPVPAALALRVRARQRTDRLVGLARGPDHRRAGSDEYEAQIVAQAFQQFQLLAARGDLDFGLQRRAYSPRGAVILRSEE